MKAQKIYIKATDELIIEGQNIKIQAGAELQMSGTKIATAQVNKKEIVTGQDLKFGAGESSDIKFDPRSSTNIVSAGCINHKVAGDYALRALGNVHIGSLGGAGLLIKDRTMGMKITTLTRFAAGGKVDTKIASDGQSIITGKAGVKVTTPTKLDMEGNVSATLESDVAVTVGKPGTANTKVKGAKTTLSATGNMIISGANIYLN